MKSGYIIFCALLLSLVATLVIKVNSPGGSFSFLAALDNAAQQAPAVPTLTNLSPSSTVADETSPAVAIVSVLVTVDGSGFTAGSVFAINGELSDDPIIFTSASKIQVPIPNRFPGVYTITVQNGANGRPSNGLPFTVSPPPPPPAITSISPERTQKGGIEFTLTVNGTGFMANDRVVFTRLGPYAFISNDAVRTTTYISPTRLTAAIPSSDIEVQGTYAIMVMRPGIDYNPSSLFINGRYSNQMGFVVYNSADNPRPTIASVNPNSGLVGDYDATLIVTGTNFMPDSVVKLDGSSLLTAYISPTQLRGQIRSLGINNTSVDNYSISVYNPPPGGGTTPTSVSFTVRNPVPAITSITPSSVAVGTKSDVVVTIRGTGFVPGNNNLDDSDDELPNSINYAGSAVTFNGAEILTNYGFSSGTYAIVDDRNILTATIPWAYLTVPGSFSITVSNPTTAGGGGVSNRLYFTVTPAGKGSAPTPPKTLSLGSSGQAVTALQQALIAKGYSISAGATGYFGPQTQAAVTKFQVANGISAIGVVGPLTRAKLQELSAASAQNSQPFKNETPLPTTPPTPGNNASDTKTATPESQSQPSPNSTGFGSGDSTAQPPPADKPNPDSSTPPPLDDNQTSTITIFNLTKTVAVGGVASFTVKSTLNKPKYTLDGPFTDTNFINPSTGEFEWKPNPDDVGTYDFTVTATGSDGQTANAKVKIEVTESKPLFDISILPDFALSNSNAFTILGLLLVVAGGLFIVYRSGKR